MPALSALPTPCLVIERSRLERNLRTMQERAESAGVALRPHIKTHKSIAIARRQIELGARGLTCATPAEAEVLVHAGFDDVRLAYPIVGRGKLERLERLARSARISFCIENRGAAEAASRLFEERGAVPAEVLIEVDTGYGRTGVPWDTQEAIDLARTVRSLRGLSLTGLLTHAGESYNGPEGDESEQDALERTSRTESERILAVAHRLYDAGLAAPERFELSVGSTPTATRFEQRRNGPFSITELRPGNYVFFDLTQVALGTVPLDACALTAYATVISRRRDAAGERAVLDAGKKTLTADRRYGSEGYGMVLSAQTLGENECPAPSPGVTLHSLSEEHGWLRLPEGSELGLGDRVRIVPNHACVAVQTQERCFLIDGDEVVARIDIDARADHRDAID